MRGIDPSPVLRRPGAATLVLVLLAGPAIAAGIDHDRLIGILNSAIPEEFAATAPVTVTDTGIDCYTLPCPYWAVENTAGSLLIGVERVVADPGDTGGELEAQLWQLLQAGDYRPVAVEGYVIDRPRPQGLPEFQRVLVVTAGPEGLLEP